MESQFAKRMTLMRDVDLVRIAADVSDEGFEPEAVFAAKVEIERRGLSHNEINEIIDDYNDHLMSEENREFKSLTVGGWIMAVLFAPIFILNVQLAIRLRSRGYTRMSNQILASIGISYTLIAFIFITLKILGI